MKDKDIIKLIKKEIGTKKEMNLKSKSKDFEEWDSIGHLNILMALEKTYGNKIHKYKGLLEADSVEQIFKIIKKIK